jgi:hypothetical protein
MDEEIDQVRSEATELVDRIQRLIPDTRFAVATFADYEYVDNPSDLLNIFGNLTEYGETGDYPWRLEQVFTTDAARVQAGVNQIALLHGGDEPEPYLRALDEASALDWRPTARRIIVLFGDAIPHDPDPGRDATLDTADDLDEATVLAHLQARGISVFSLQATGGAAPAFYQTMAAETGGEWYALGAAGEAVDAIGDLVEQDVAQLRQVTLRPAAGYTEWVRWEPQVFPTVEGGGQANFAVQICMPLGAASGDHSFDLAVVASGAQIAAIPVTIRGPFAWWAWLPWLLAPLLLGLLAFWWLSRARRPKQTRTPPRGKPAAGPKPPPTYVGGGPKPPSPPSGSSVTHGRDKKPPK